MAQKVGPLTKVVILDLLSEFNSPEVLHQYWKDCDENNDDEMDFDEYVMCRGDYDQLGNFNDVNEYTYRENVMVMDFVETKSSAKPLAHLQYDENGIIID